MSLPELRTIAVVTACMKQDGTPTFVINEVSATQEQLENGIHYYFAESQLLIDGYEEPFVHFDEDEAPPFLHLAVSQHLALTHPSVHQSEESACLASSS
jgi:hypothetical protein